MTCSRQLKHGVTARAGRHTKKLGVALSGLRHYGQLAYLESEAKRFRHLPEYENLICMVQFLNET